MKKPLLFLTLLIMGLGAVVGCGQGGTQEAGIPVPNSIVILPNPVAVTLEATRVFTAAVYDQDNNVLNVMPSWEVVGNIGTIISDGLFTATAEGAGIVKAIYEGISSEAAITVKGNFFPHEIGYNWTYSLSGTDETRVNTVTGTSTQIVTGEMVTIFNDTQKDGNGNTIYSTDAYYKITDSGVYYHGSAVAIFSPSLQVLSLPLSVGKIWTSSFSEWTYTMTVKAFEDVTTPAGTFKCYKIEVALISDHYGSFTFYIWYGNNAGLVKILDLSSGWIQILQSKNS